MTAFSEDEIIKRLDDFPGWSLDDGVLHRVFEFDGFPAAIGFMVQASRRIDALNHHPEWTNVYNKVDVRLTSHDAGGVTASDFELARVLDELAEPTK